MWGRDGLLQRIESVDLSDGTVEPLLEAPDAVQVATANRDLSRLYFITVDAGSNLPTGLWVDDVADDEDAREIAYQFDPTRVSNRFKYRLVASDDGSLLAVQPDEGPVSIVDVGAGSVGEVRPGAPMIGFAAHHLITLGPGSSVLSFDPRTLNGRRLAESVASVQVISGGRWVAVMYLDEERPRWYRIDALDPETGAGMVAYVHDTDDVGPLLPRKDRQFVGADAPDGWIVLADTFFPFIVGPSGQTTKPLEASRFPRLINVETAEIRVIGPFVER